MGGNTGVASIWMISLELKLCRNCHKPTVHTSDRRVDLDPDLYSLRYQPATCSASNQFFSGQYSNDASAYHLLYSRAAADATVSLILMVIILQLARRVGRLADAVFH